MSYKCGLGASMATFGLEPGPPKVVCDGCGLAWRIERNPPPSWFLDGKPPPRWTGWRTENERVDLCPRCKEGGFEVSEGTRRLGR